MEGEISEYGENKFKVGDRVVLRADKDSKRDYPPFIGRVFTVEGILIGTFLRVRSADLYIPLHHSRFDLAPEAVVDEEL